MLLALNPRKPGGGHCFIECMAWIDIGPGGSVGGSVDGGVGWGTVNLNSSLDYSPMQMHGIELKSGGR